ncbi:hypothetical protein GWC77_21555 [Paraburkholderia sp. NMBU_R16]|uniref:hypothetical protein n=1 Tax=Paraburkholderia sp. NMBU_R16 TaxID=2698676 RepID=UPI0015653649|nr:hypothetical protein [Paraburkholderia sp. NMBU_R16]NRO98514.1 hypothetical protein [Paraburkholderia sp. NMBU_R16]
MFVHPAPPATPVSRLGWRRLIGPSGERLLVRPGDGEPCLCVRESLCLARDGAGRPRVALTLVLARAPTPADASIAPLVVGGSLSMICTLAPEADAFAYAEQRLSEPCAGVFIRAGAAFLRDAQRVYRSFALLGRGDRIALGAYLGAHEALDALHAFDGTPSSLWAGAKIEGPQPVPIPATTLDQLLGGVLDGLDRRDYISLVITHADGTTQRAPWLAANLKTGDSGASRDAKPGIAMIAMSHQFMSIPQAMTPAAAHAPAAALIPGGASAHGTRIDDHTQFWLLADAHFPVTPTDGDSDTAGQHLPLIDQPSGGYWKDALDASIFWYAPTFELVMPTPRDDPASASFAFIYTATGATLGAGGLKPGVSATLRVTVAAQMPAAATAALASLSSASRRQVPLGGLCAALELTYRQSGAQTPSVQRFPGTVVQNGNVLAVSIALLDDWARLAYSALAYPGGDGGTAARLVIDYTFSAYQNVFVGSDVQIVAGGKVVETAVVQSRAELPPVIDRPFVVAKELAVVGPTASVSYHVEQPNAGAQRAPVLSAIGVHAVAPVSNAIGSVHAVAPLSGGAGSVHTATSIVPVVQPAPILTPQIPIRRRLMTRSMLRENAIDLAFPCAQYGTQYAQQGSDGQLASVGCQDAFRLGDTPTKAFAEVDALHDPAYRVYRSLQQPGRFLVMPTTYRAGRYSLLDGDKAFRPMLMVYGVLDPDPANDRYFIAATLVADVSACKMALLRRALCDQVPANVVPSIVLPTDPFVGATLSYAWAVPAGVATPECLNAVDAITVTMSMSMTDAAILTAQIERNGVDGSVTFTLADGTVFTAALSLSGDVVGPADTGPVVGKSASGQWRLTNRTQQPVNVLDAASIDANGNVVVAAINAVLAPGASMPVQAAAGTVTLLAEARLAAATTIDEVDVFVENVTVTVTFINQVNFGNHQLTALSVRAKMKASDHVEETVLGEAAVATVTFTLPITNYLAQQVLQFMLVKTTPSATTETSWCDWDLSRGAVIGITADRL